MQKIAIIGATGLVGKNLLEILASEQWPTEQLDLVASTRSADKTLSYRGKELVIQDIATYDFSQAKLALFAVGNDIAKEYAPRAVAKACWVIDKSSHFRMDPAVPLIVPEVNLHHLDSSKPCIVASPNCSTIQLVMALKPLHDLAKLRHVQVATYQAVSGAGQQGMDALAEELALWNTKHSLTTAPKLGAPILFNVVPKIDALEAHGYTKEEMKMHEETRKILDLPELMVDATAVRVPVWEGHSEAVHLSTQHDFSLDEAMNALQQTAYLNCVADPTILSPAAYAPQSKDVWVSRVRRHPAAASNSLSLWVVSNNLLKGAAWNAWQIATHLLKK